MSNNKLSPIYTTNRGKALLDAISGFNTEFTKAELVELALELYADDLIVQLINKTHGEFSKRTLKPGRKSNAVKIESEEIKHEEFKSHDTKVLDDEISLTKETNDKENIETSTDDEYIAKLASYYE